ncbi:MAG: hypothetical protein E7302_14185 [Butyrivibrio sp.]|nr:hypothetical protein [Butyrivibrio sp.]
MDKYKYVNDIFQKNFIYHKNKRILLYGNNLYTEYIIKHSISYNIVGLMDENINQGSVYDYKGVNESLIREGLVDIIVVVAEPIALKDIYHRLRKICAENFVQLYGIDGKNLFEVYKDDSETGMPESAYLFRKLFLKHKHKKIVIYGKGPIARSIINNCPDYNIVGVMDRQLKKGAVEGKRVLDFEDVIDLKADMIVTATKDSNAGAIFFRIKDFCTHNNIGLYDYKGHNLYCMKYENDNSDKNVNGIEYTRAELEDRIKSHSVISFDIFDTLIMRKTLNATDVFDIVQNRIDKQGLDVNDFKYWRKKAQATTPIANCTLFEIYQRLQELINLSDDDRDTIMDLELEVEKSVLIPRYDMVEVYNKCIQSNKRVFLVSDMYIPGKLLEEFLDKYNITGYEKLIVSCDYRSLKLEHLFDHFLEQANCKVEEILHIGDDKEFDGVCARNRGIDTFVINSAKELLSLSSWACIRNYLKNTNERSMVGLVLANVFNSPFYFDNKDDTLVEIDNSYDLGYEVVAPLITAITLWIIGQVEGKGYSKILFGSRDGYLPNQLYKIFIDIIENRSLPQSMYFLVSRRMAMGAAVENEKDMRSIFWYAPKYDIEMNYHFRGVGDIPDSADEELDVIWEFWNRNKEKIISGSKRNKENFQKYLDNNEITKKGKYAFFDFVSQGSVQYYLENIGIIDFDSYYACFRSTNLNGRERLKHKEWLYVNEKDENDILAYRDSDHFYRDYIFLEGIMSSDMPSLACFDDNGEPVFDEEHRTAEELDFVVQIHKAIKDYFTEYISDLWINDVEISNIVPDMLYYFRQPQYTKMSEKLYSPISAFDDMILKRVDDSKRGQD